jgi:hypothetical protein
MSMDPILASFMLYFWAKLDALRHQKDRMTTELDQAKQKLIEHGGYAWLLEGGAFWSAKQVIEELGKNGRQVSVSTVNRWFRELPHTQGGFGPGCLTASKNDLIVLFASQMGQSRRRSD